MSRAAAGWRRAWTHLRHGRAMAQVRASGLFDEATYLARHPDVAASGVDPVLHYLRAGWREGRDPHPLFDTRGYQEKEAGAGGVAPLLHFLWRAAGPVEAGRGRVLLLADGEGSTLASVVADAVAAAGGEAITAMATDVEGWERGLARSAALVVCGLGVEGRGAQAWLRARQHRRRVLWAAREVTFEPNLYLEPAAFAALPPEARRGAIAAAPGRRVALLAADVVLAPDAKLADAMQAAGVGRVLRLDRPQDRVALAGALAL